ncbi:hypothetical protein [Prevotella multiformis]|uniref:hypothetical protein n=1 Tax=Prevotella multiformis TaxID=282402 RepID=UPI0028DB7A4B|nr:hypothetical protein [Prevotella multiformis]
MKRNKREELHTAGGRTLPPVSTASRACAGTGLPPVRTSGYISRTLPNRFSQPAPARLSCGDTKNIGEIHLRLVRRHRLQRAESSLPDY